MADIISSKINGANFDDVSDAVVALYDAGYRKQSEGEWVDQYHGEYANQLYKCSVCGGKAHNDEDRWFLTPFCPNCGARMGGGAE